MAGLTLKDILDTANKYYSDGYLSEYYDENGNPPKVRGSGDKLAEFIVLELRETFDENASYSEKISTAIRSMTTAISDISSVLRAFNEVSVQS
jgi:hypothetical protein